MRAQLRMNKHIYQSFAFVLLCGGAVITSGSTARADHHLEEPRVRDTAEETSTPIQLAQQQRRRPGAKDEGGIRERRESFKDRPPTAVTPKQAKKVAERIKKSYDAPVEIPDPSEEFIPVYDRWAMLYEGKWWDPYNQNKWKGDLPIFGKPGSEWFLAITAESDSLYEIRRAPTPVSITSIEGPGRNDIFGDPDQVFINQNFIFEVALIKGDTAFKPQDFELRVTPVFNINYVDVEESGVVRINPTRGTSRKEEDFTLLEAFIDIHLGNISDRYDFFSTRIGIQEFNADFRGLLYIDEQPGVRFFGNIDNNIYQWNLAWFHRLEKDANSLLNKLFESRREDVFIFNLYAQDIIAKGHNLEFVAIYREDTFGKKGLNFDENSFLTSPPSIGTEQPKSIRNTYLGLNSDGHFGRLNVSTAFYWAFGSESNNPIAGRPVDINAFFGAAELSVDIDWLRPRFTVVWASGDDDPADGDAEGFDAIFDNPNLIGGENSFWVRQGIPLIGGGGVAVTDRSSLLADLRAGKPQGQSNFVNPGVFILNAGLDIDVTPKLIMFNNANWLWFSDTATIERTRQDGSIDDSIGLDLSTGIIYRPWLNNNVEFVAGFAALLPGDGFKNLYGDKNLFQGFANLKLLY